jgi:hypothetical protein
MTCTPKVQHDIFYHSSDKDEKSSSSEKTTKALFLGSTKRVPLMRIVLVGLILIIYPSMIIIVHGETRERSHVISIALLVGGFFLHKS